MEITTIILAAGQGTRMRSVLPKVLHPLAGRPLIEYALQLAEKLTTQKPVVVVGHGAEAVRQYVGDRARFVVQHPQLGTAHAVQSAEGLLTAQPGLLLVMYADMPLFTEDTMSGLIDAQMDNAQGPLSMLTMRLPDSHGFGRIVRAADGSVQEIVEEAQATPEELSLQELNVGLYCFQSEWLWQALRRVPLSPKGEYYLTDTVGIAVADGLKVRALSMADPREAIGINTRVHLAEAEAILRQRINMNWMLCGVTLIDPLSTYIHPDAVIGRDTVIYPNTHLLAGAQVGMNCQLGPDTTILNSRVGSGSRVFSARIQDCDLPDGSQVGPYVYWKGGEETPLKARD